MEKHAPDMTYPNIEDTLRVEIRNRNIQKFREANEENRERDAQEQKEIGKITQPLYDFIKKRVDSVEFKEKAKKLQQDTDKLATPVRFRPPNKEQIAGLKKQIYRDAQKVVRRREQVKQKNQTETEPKKSDSRGATPNG
jgi:uncharacterized protein with von Willebrand factor type A (vWA) domain